MKIHSNFRDYYDSAIAYGIDPTIRYIRKSRDGKMDPVDLFRYVEKRVDWESFVVGFCGVLYPGIKYARSSDQFKYFPDKSEEPAKKRRRRYGSIPVFRMNDSFSNWWLSQRRETDEPFLQVKAPVFVVYQESVYGHQPKIVVNPFLKELEFFRVKDPVTAFQDIATYISNILVQPDKPDEIADKYKIGQHGFDKWSFRKEPQS